MSKIYGSPLWLSGGGGMNDTLPPLLDNFKATRNEGNITLSASKMEESRAKELAGAVWVYGDHIPKNVNDGTKIQLTRGEITRPDGEIYITLSDISASDAEIETIVNLKESDGQLHPYIYLSNDYEGSGAALLLRKDIYQKGQFYSAVEPYNGSNLDNWCEGTFSTAILDSHVQENLVSVNIQVQGSYISRRCFALSIVEYGWGASAPEGTALPYFKDNKARISLYQGSSADYYTRTYQAGNIWFIGLMGNAGTNSGTLSLGYRPAICIKKSFKLKAIPNEDGSYDMYDETSSISTYASSEFIVEKSVLWEQTKDFHVRQFTYNSKKQYQTMLESAVASAIYSEFPEEPTDYLNCAEIPNTTEYEIPEDGWFRIDAIAKSGDGRRELRFTGTPIYEAAWYSSGGGGTGGYSRSEVALFKGDKLSIQITDSDINITGNSILINVTSGKDGNPASQDKIGTGGAAGTASGGNKINQNGLKGSDGNRVFQPGIGGKVDGGKGANQGEIQINNQKSYAIFGGNSASETKFTSSGMTEVAETSGNIAKVFISRGNTNIPSPSKASTLSLIPKNNSVEATWENSGDPVQTGTMLVYNTSHTPKSPSDGVVIDVPLAQPVTLALISNSEELQENSKKQSYTITGVPNDKPVFVALFPYDKDRKYGLAKQEVEIPREHSWYDKQQELESEVETVKAEMADYQSYYTTTQEVLK